MSTSSRWGPTLDSDAMKPLKGNSNGLNRQDPRLFPMVVEKETNAYINDSNSTCSSPVSDRTIEAQERKLQDPRLLTDRSSLQNNDSENLKVDSLHVSSTNVPVDFVGKQVATTFESKVPLEIPPVHVKVDIPSSSAEPNDDGDGAPDYDDFELIDKVEWGPGIGEPGYDEDQELAPKPRRIKPDPCGCQPTGVEYTEDGFILPSVCRPVACLDDRCILFATAEECGKNCEAYPACGNRRLQNKEFCDVEVFDAGIKGRGLRLSKDGTCKKGNIVAEYVGRAILSSNLPRLFRRYERDRRLYIMALGNGIYLDARNKGGKARYINHSCDPNCRVERWKVIGVIRAAVVALREIQPNEEFTFDYQWERKRGHAPTVCYCGSSNCRGTLEAPKSLEEQDLEKQLEGHWEKTNKRDQSIVNRMIRILSKEHQEYFIGEITGYNSKKRLHCVFYKHDMNEVWEDLYTEKWMILNETKNDGNVLISRKVQKPKISARRLLVNNMNDDVTPAFVKNYVYVQTPVKETFWSHRTGIIERCERSCGVHILADQQSRPPFPANPDDPEEVEKYAALDKSVDGTVWKLTISGSNVPGALEFLEKNIIHFDRKVSSTEEGARTSLIASSRISSVASQLSSIDEEDIKEVLFPRILVDMMKKRIGLVRDKWRSVAFQFIIAENKEDRFGRLLVSGNNSFDLECAMEQLWSLLTSLSAENNLSQTPNLVYQDLGFLGGIISGIQYKTLCSCQGFSQKNADLKDSPFIKSFESTNKCSMWIEQSDDKNPNDPLNSSVHGSDKNRKIFFGSSPSYVPKLWSMIQKRLTELSRGVLYYYLGGDRVYQKLMMANDGKFFKFLSKMTGASVAIDPMTGDHLRIDGRLDDDCSLELNHALRRLTDSQRADLAEKLIRLQIEIYCDHCTRQYRWTFGRDWQLTVLSPGKSTESYDSNSSDVRTLHRKTVSSCGMDIAEIVSRLRLHSSTAAHAALVLYRFLYASDEFVSQFRSREVVLACIYIANKAQSLVEHKSLEATLRAGYDYYYPGSTFDSTSREAEVLEEKVLGAENEILLSLNYDIFWEGIEKIRVVAMGSGKLKRDFLDCVFTFAFSGQILSAGAELWLKYGVEYIFAASAAFLKADLSDLIPAMSLVPLKVLQAAELIAESAKFGKPSVQDTPSHFLLEFGKDRLEKYIGRIKTACIEITQSTAQHSSLRRKSLLSIKENMYQSIALEHNCCRIIRRISQASVQVVLPMLDCIGVDSSCTIFIGHISDSTSNDIVLQGHLRAIEVAYSLMVKFVPATEVFPPPENFSDDFFSHAKEIQSKSRPGFLNSFDIETSNGWEDTIQLSCPRDTPSAERPGGKHYVAAKVSEKSLRQSGLGWLIPPVSGLSPNGALSDSIFPTAEYSQQLSVLADLTDSLVGLSDSFVVAESRQPRDERYLPVSIQRWPLEKILLKEIQRWKKSKEKGLKIGFSPSALQELQLLRQLHCLIPSARGHPNFVLPIGIALPEESEDSSKDQILSDQVDDNPDAAVLSLFRMNGEHEKSVKRSKKIKESPSLIFNAAPFTLHRILSKKVKIEPLILTAWFYDCLSMLVHCHASNIVLCTLHSDQILIDQSGVAKLGSLYRCRSSLVEGNVAIVAADKQSRSSKKKSDVDDFSNDFYISPELLLGYTKYTKESDVWAVGSLLANLLLNKPMFAGRDRKSFLINQYKVVGVPETSNFRQGKDLPNYFSPPKKYRPNVEKAFHAFMKTEEPLYKKHIDLLSRMLQLDPSKRCTALEALDDEMFHSYKESCLSHSYEQKFASEWIEFKRGVLNSNQQKDNYPQDIVRKRSAIQIESSTSNTDDLYDINDFVVDNNVKRQRDNL